jgi:hypothetical protein
MTSVVNLALLFGAPTPSFAYAIFLRGACNESQYHLAAFKHGAVSSGITWPDMACAFGYQHPFLTANALFFLNVSVLFWIISILQQSTWLIDPYWWVQNPIDTSQ